MPDQDGLAFLRAVRANHPSLPFILFTGQDRNRSPATRSPPASPITSRRAVRSSTTGSPRASVTPSPSTKRSTNCGNGSKSSPRFRRSATCSPTATASPRAARTGRRVPPAVAPVPETAVASLAVDDDEFTSPGYEPPARQISAHDVTTAGNELVLTVGYTTDPPPGTDGDVFLPEERALTTILQLVTAYLDRRHVLSDLRVADRRLTLILEHATAVMYLKDTDGRYVFVNAEYERLFELEAEDLVGRRDADLYPADVVGAVESNDRRVVETGEPIEVEERITVQGEDRTYLSLKVPALNDAGDVEGVFGVSTEITEQKNGNGNSKRSTARSAIAVRRDGRGGRRTRGHRRP